MKERSLNHEKRIRAYLFSGCFERHKLICKNIGVKPNIENKYKKAYFLLMEYWDSLPDEEKKNIDKELKEIGL